MRDGQGGTAEGTQEARIRILRQRCLERKTLAWRDTSAATARALRATEGLSSWQVRKGAVVRERLRSLRFALDDEELLIGRLAPALPADREAAAAAREYLATFPAAGGQTGHCELDRQRLFALGVDGLLADLRRRLAAAAAESEAAEALESFGQALQGFSDMITHAALAAEAQIEEAVGERRREVETIALACRRIAHDPPGTFREALQLAWFMDLATMVGEGVSLVVAGRLDRSLLPFYRRDVEAGRLSEAEALVLLECLYVLTNELVPDGLAMSVMVGGTDATGRDTTNPLSYLCLEALRRTRLVYPTVGVCWHDGTPAALTDLAVELMGLGIPNPAFFGDAVIRRGLEALGVPREESGDYINSTCVEITPVASSNVWVASPYFSTPGILIEEIAAQAEAGRPVPTFDAFLTAYRSRLGEQIARAVAEQNRLRERRRLHGRKPLQSLFTRDCVERGCDIDAGGARYNWVECSFVGLANLADSLAVVRQEVFQTGAMTFADLRDTLADNFAGREDVRARFLACPKYGNDEPLVDGLLQDVVRFVEAECARHRLDPDRTRFVPGAFCWVMHERLGKACVATPDGREAGTPFADGCGPAQGRERRGPTAAILSTTSWDHSPLIGGAAYNMKFPRRLFAEPTAADRLRDLVLTFLRRGGFETQVNVVDADVLIAARQHPDRYRDLIVRIGGYTDYFVRLSPEMQDEVIRRTALTLNAGRPAAPR